MLSIFLCLFITNNLFANEINSEISEGIIYKPALEYDSGQIKQNKLQKGHNLLKPLSDDYINNPQYKIPDTFSEWQFDKRDIFEKTPKNAEKFNVNKNNNRQQRSRDRSGVRARIGKGCQSVNKEHHGRSGSSMKKRYGRNH